MELNKLTLNRLTHSDTEMEMNRNVELWNRKLENTLRSCRARRTARERQLFQQNFIGNKCKMSPSSGVTIEELNIRSLSASGNESFADNYYHDDNTTYRHNSDTTASDGEGSGNCFYFDNVERNANPYNAKNRNLKRIEIMALDNNVIYEIEELSEQSETTERSIIRNGYIEQVRQILAQQNRHGSRSKFSRDSIRKTRSSMGFDGEYLNVRNSLRRSSARRKNKSIQNPSIPSSDIISELTPSQRYRKLKDSVSSRSESCVSDDISVNKNINYEIQKDVVDKTNIEVKEGTSKNELNNEIDAVDVKLEDDNSSESCSCFKLCIMKNKKKRDYHKSEDKKKLI